MPATGKSATTSGPQALRRRPVTASDAPRRPASPACVSSSGNSKKRAAQHTKIVCTLDELGSQATQRRNSDRRRLRRHSSLRGRNSSSALGRLQLLLGIGFLLRARSRCSPISWHFADSGISGHEQLAGAQRRRFEIRRIGWKDLPTRYASA